jgi:PIN domain nuclease of toxin-antitoxin system
MEVGKWVSRSESLPFIKFVPVNNAIELKSVKLPGPLDADPADRVIIATARSLGAPIITKDKRPGTYPHVKSIW